MLPVQGNIYLLNLGDVNIVAQVGDDGILLVDSRPGGVERAHRRRRCATGSATGRSAISSTRTCIRITSAATPR